MRHDEVGPYYPQRTRGWPWLARFKADWLPMQELLVSVGQQEFWRVLLRSTEPSSRGVLRERCGRLRGGIEQPWIFPNWLGAPLLAEVVRARQGAGPREEGEKVDTLSLDYHCIPSRCRCQPCARLSTVTLVPPYGLPVPRAPTSLLSPPMRPWRLPFKPVSITSSTHYTF